MPAVTVHPTPCDSVPTDAILDAFTDWDAVARRLHGDGVDLDTLLLAVRHPEEKIRRDAAQLATQIPRVMERVFDDPIWDVRDVAASSTATPLSCLEQLVNDRSKVVRRSVAGNPNTTVEMLDQLAVDDEETVRIAVARSKQPLSSRSISGLAADVAFSVRKEMAVRRDLPEVLVRALAVDRDVEVRCAVAQHATLPTDLAVELATRRDRLVHDALVWNPGIGPRVLELLARSPFLSTRRTVAPYRRLPAGAAEALAVDEDRWVRRGVGHRRDVPHLLVRLAADPELEVRLAVAMNSSAPGNALDILATNASVRIRELVAINPRARVSTLEMLLGDTRPAVRQAARTQLATRLGLAGPDDIDPPTGDLPTLDDGLRRVFSWLDRSHRVDELAQIALAPRVPIEVRGELLDHPDVSAATLRAAAAHPDHQVRRLVADLPHCPAEVMLVLTKDRSLAVRRELVRRSDLPERVIAHLMRDDGDIIIRHTAVRRLSELRSSATWVDSRAGTHRMRTRGVR